MIQTIIINYKLELFQKLVIKHKFYNQQLRKPLLKYFYGGHNCVSLSLRTTKLKYFFMTDSINYPPSFFSSRTILQLKMEQTLFLDYQCRLSTTSTGAFLRYPCSSSFLTIAVVVNIYDNNLEISCDSGNIFNSNTCCDKS